MVASSKRLEEALAGAGVSPEAAPSIAAELQRILEESVAAQAEAAPPKQPPGADADSVAARMIRLEQKFDDLRELMMVQAAHVDHRFDEMDRRFVGMPEDMDRRFGAVDDRFDRERRERLGFLTAAAGAIVAALLRLFGVI